MLSPFMISEPHHRSEIGKVKVGKLPAGRHEVSQPRPEKRPCGQIQAVAGSGGFASGAAPDSVLQGPFQALCSDSGRQTGPRRSKSVLAASQLRLALLLSQANRTYPHKYSH